MGSGFDLSAFGGCKLHMQRIRPALTGIGLRVARHGGDSPTGPEEFHWNLLSGYFS
jgi:hypothetical protein